MTRILLTGVNGQVGWELWRFLVTIGEVIPTSREGGNGILKLDLSQPDDIRSVINEVSPQLIVNAAAYTAVDRAEIEPELAMMINGIAPGIIAEEAKRLGAGIIHYSTDYVFDGVKGYPYVETDQTHPLNVYGQTKLAGELAVQAIDCPHLIFRTSWVYGLRGKNFLLTMLRLAREKEVLQVVNDQIGSPTWCGTIAQITGQILAGSLNETLDDRRGLYHLTSTGEASWYDFASSIFELTADTEERKLTSLQPINSEHYPSPVQRPHYSLLSVECLAQTFGIRLPNWRETLAIALKYK
jgi:dTDP-4-dehydrorhamnose reductase